MAGFRVAQLAAGQFGVVSRFQLQTFGVTDRVIARWRKTAFLHRLLPGVYAVGHVGRSREVDLAAALLYAGPGAMLDAVTAGCWLSLTRRWPEVVQVRTPRSTRARAGIEIRRLSPLRRWWHDGLPVAPVPHVLLGLAAHQATSQHDLEHAIAQAEYHEWLDRELIEPLLRRGRPGAANLRKALRDYHPQLAHTRSDFERLMVRLCQGYGIDVPRFNARIETMTVDALWPNEKLIVELDGRRGHQSWARIQRDRRRDLRLRALGHTVLRYVWGQLEHEHAAVAQDIVAARAR